MQVSRFAPPKFFFRPFVYGLSTCIVVLVIRHTVLSEDMRYVSNWTSNLFFLFLAIGAFVYLKRFTAAPASTMEIFQASIMYGAGVGIAVGLFHYINVTILDTDYLQKVLNTSYRSWADNGYSKEAIAAQVELTDTFQNPAKWSLVLTLFYFLLSAGISFIIGLTISKTKPSITSGDPTLNYQA